MPASSTVDTHERAGENISLPIAADTRIWQGALVARDASGRAVPAADAANLRVIGRAEQTVDNTGGDAGAATITVKRGVFGYANSVPAAVTQAHVGSPCWVEDDETVASDDGDHNVYAGMVVALEGSIVWVDTRLAALLSDVAAQIAAATN